MALNSNENQLGRVIIKQIPKNNIKKYFLQLFSYLRIKPIYFIKIKHFLLWKR